MKKMVSPIAAAVLLCCTLLIGAAPVAAAETDCTTQGALALALAQLVDKSIATTEQAVQTLSALGVEPDGGWKVAECLTREVIAQVTAAYGAAVAAGRREGGLVAGQVGVALELLGPPDRIYPSVSNISPSGQ